MSSDSESGLKIYGKDVSKVDATETGLGSSEESYPSGDENEVEEDSHSHNDDDDDVFSSGEEEMIRRMTAMRGASGAGRRLSSLDAYLLQPKEEPILYVLKSKESLKDVIEEVKAFHERDAQELTEEQRRQLASDQKRQEMIMARLQRDDDRRRESIMKEIASTKITKVMSAAQGKRFGGLSREKRARLKNLLMQKAKEEYYNEQMELLRIKETHLNTVCPPLQLDNLNDENPLKSQSVVEQLRQVVKNLHAKALQAEASKLELEEKIFLQMEEMHDIMEEIQQAKGRFAIPVLRKVRRKQTRKAARIRIGQNVLVGGSDSSTHRASVA